MTIKDELYEQYDWFCSSFLPPIQSACDEFFSDSFLLKLISVSKNINILFQGDDYFVTKIRLDKNHDVFFRCSGSAIEVILNNCLGENKKFELTQLTDLEAKIISSFNDYLYESVAAVLLTPPAISTSQKRRNYDVTHLTFIIKDKFTNEGGKLIVSIPQVLLLPTNAKAHDEKFSVASFKTSKIPVDIRVGTTKFPVKDLKHLEKEDIVLFENSNIHSMQLIYNDYVKIFSVNPNPGLMTSLDDNDGGHIMEEKTLSQNMWDNIQVEMGAEFEKVKISLGELKSIEQGLVLDISSVYNNKISLKVENKTIAKGELVIINDRYGVRIDEVFASENMPTEEVENVVVEAEEVIESENDNSDDDEFDYSDFELDEQDI